MTDLTKLTDAELDALRHAKGAEWDETRVRMRAEVRAVNAEYERRQSAIAAAAKASGLSTEELKAELARRVGK